MSQDLMECDVNTLREMVMQLEEQVEQLTTGRPWRFEFREPEQLVRALLEGWVFELCPAKQWLEVHASFSDRSVSIQGPTSSETVIETWGYQLTDFQKKALQQFEQGVFVVRDYGCDVHPRLGTQRSSFAPDING